MKTNYDPGPDLDPVFPLFSPKCENPEKETEKSLCFPDKPEGQINCAVRRDQVCPEEDFSKLGPGPLMVMAGPEISHALWHVIRGFRVAKDAMRR